jgi:tetratricopeptide (TPR) repeat protein
MNSLLLRRCLFYNAFLLLIIFSGCKSHTKKGQTTSAYTVNAGDTITTIDTIITKVDGMVTANRLEQAIGYISINIHRFKGKEKARLYDQRGNTYFLEDDLENAIANYLSAAELDSENSTYLLNVAKTYENMENMNNAAFFAKKVLTLQNVSDTDMTIAKELLLRSDRMHAGH